MLYVGKNPKIDLLCNACSELNQLFYHDILKELSTIEEGEIICSSCEHTLITYMKLLNSINRYLRTNRDTLGRKRFFAKVG